MEQKHYHILLVDDNEAIHEDIEAILSSGQKDADKELREMEDDLFGPTSTDDDLASLYYEIDHAYQGEEAIKMVDKAESEDNPYSLVFMDVRMPPGLDGIQTIKRIWEKHPYTEMVICTAYSDYSWDEIVRNLGNTDKLLFMKKPFDATALKQTALTLTTKWKLQQESIAYTEKLEKEVQERTKELNNLVKEYKKMKDKAERATEAKSAFLANMSHEIRTPMNGVIGMNDLLLETELDAEQKELSKMVKTSAKSLLRVINDILDFSKMEANKMEIEEVPFTIEEIVREVILVISFSKDKKELDINYTIDDDIPERMLGDPTRIRQILVNYGSNAVKFTERGEVSFEIKQLEVDSGKHLIKFTVKDTGPGIPKEKQSGIFKSFSQASSSTSRNYGGTGLGLAICRQLAELMNGEVGVDSELGKGSAFWFTVTLEKCKGEEGKKAARVQNKNEKLEPFLPQHRILVAEDNQINQMVARKILEKEGFEVDIVETGTAAVKAVEENDYAFVLMDIQMPVMHAPESTEHIQHAQPEKIIIAHIANAVAAEKQKCIDAGCDDFITKPVNIDELYAKIDKYIPSEINVTEEE
jgi:signal transduction histidine kinase